MQRRQFLSQMVAAAGTLAGSASRGSNVQQRGARQPMFVGIQIAPHSLLDEGISRCLDRLQDIAQVNTLLCYSHTYHMGYSRPPQVMAADHGVPVRDIRRRKLPRIWVRHDPRRFQDLLVKHPRLSQEYEYHDQDVFVDLIEAAHTRGMKVHARILEAGMRRQAFIPGYAQVAAIDLNGQPSHGPCWNHPEYRRWLGATVEDLMQRYPLDGLQYGAERVGALSETLFRGMAPACFCEHCCQRNQGRGIDAERAKVGYRKLYDLMQQLEQGKAKPTDGVVIATLRLMLHYPEILAWYREWFAADEEIGRLLRDTVKAARPEATFGRHIDHQRSSYDVFYRAAVSYAEIAQTCDYVKPILYHDILGRRLRWWALDRMQSRVLSDFTLEQSLELLYAVLGHQVDEQPGLAELNDRGLSPAYVYRETQRCVASVAGQAQVYSGIGMDVPWHLPNSMEPVPSDPEILYQACMRAFEAGADGLVASREYDEMRIPSLRAFGRAVRDASS